MSWEYEELSFDDAEYKEIVKELDEVTKKINTTEKKIKEVL